MTMALAIIGCFLFFTQEALAVIEIRKDFVERLDPPPGGLEKLDQRQVYSAILCATWCLVNGPQCTCFLYSKTAGTCIIGSLLKASIPTTSVSDGDIYVVRGSDYFQPLPSACPTGDGFFMYSHNSNVICLFPKTARENYQDAELYCENHGGHLFTPKTLAKYDLLKQVMREYLPVISGSEYSSAIYIGLRTTNGNGVYRWEDDQTALSDDFRSLAFQAGDPVSADCCIMMFNQVLGDRPCQEKLRYVCEYPL